jgi:hypothetical protein
MTRSRLVLGGACLLALALGCAKTIDEPVDPAKAAEVLQGALDAWKKGEKQTDLHARKPAVYLNEPEWAAGKELVSYSVGPVELSGRQGRAKVKLTLRDKAGKTAEREIGYLIDTTPQVVITREALGP